MYRTDTSGMDGDAAKIKMFVASKKAVNRQDSTLKNYAKEICNVLDFLGKRIKDITCPHSGFLAHRGDGTYESSKKGWTLKVGKDYQKAVFGGGTGLFKCGRY